VGRADRAGADRDRADHDLAVRPAEVDEAGAGGDDVGDRVERPDLVEVDVVGLGPVDPGLGGGERREHLEGELPRGVVEGRRLEEADCLVVVAGMEGALPSVVGGLTGVPMVAVPTSIGYGASFGGLAALLAMLNSCAPGVTVVNIDNGYGAGVFAARVARRVRR